jgi:hypothetical protein
MARVFSITAAATSLRTDAQGRAESAFTVSNSSGRPLRGRVEVKATNSAQQGWLSIAGEQERNFAAGVTHQISVKIAVPPGSPAGTCSFRLEVVSVQNPDEDFAEGPTVSFEIAAPAVKPKGFPWWIVVAAAVVVIVGVTGYYLTREKKAEPIKETGKGKALDKAKAEQPAPPPAKPEAPPGTCAKPGTRVAAGDLLVSGHEIKSPDGQYRLTYQADGNLVLYRGTTALWATMKFSAPGRATMQSDGNFVVYDNAGRAVWASGTQGHAGAWLSIQNDGTLAIYEKDCVRLWGSAPGA